MPYTKRKSPIDHFLAHIDEKIIEPLLSSLDDGSFSDSQIESFLSSKEPSTRIIAARMSFHSGIKIPPQTVQKGLTDSNELVVLAFLPLADIFFEHTPEGLFRRKMNEIDKRRVVKNLVSRSARHPSIRHAAIEHPDIPLSEKDIDAIVFGPFNLANAALEPPNIRVAIARRENVHLTKPRTEAMIDHFEKDVIIALCGRENMEDPQWVLDKIRDRISDISDSPHKKPMRLLFASDIQDINAAVEMRQVLIDREKLISTADTPTSQSNRKTSGFL